MTKLAPNVDGDLSEWPDVPTLAFTSASGRRTDVWISASKQGLVVAARGDTRALSLSLSSPPAKFPVIGFANQFGETVVDPDYCSQLMQDGSPRPNLEACRRWFDAAVVRHEELLRWFKRTIDLEEDVLLVQRERVASAPIRRGDAVEFTLSSRAFPSTDLASLDALTVSLRVGDHLTEQVVATFDAPLAFGDPPNLLSDLLDAGGTGDQLRFYQPGPTVDHVAVAYNRPLGYQYEPVEPSPFIGRISLTRRKTLLTVEGRKLLELPRDFGHPGELPGYAWENADGSLTLLSYVSRWGDAARAVVVRRGGVDLLFGSEQMQSLLGTGACGACTIGVMRVVRVTADATETVADEFVAPGSGDSVDVSVDRAGRRLTSTFACDGQIPTKVDVVFDPKTETYERRVTGVTGACAY